MPLIGLMRVKNEERWLERAIKSLLPVCDYVYVFDDHSTDRTREIIQTYGCLVPSPFPNEDLNEARDNTHLLQVAMNYRVPVKQMGPQSPHWFLHVDGDEELVESSRDTITSTMNFCGGNTILEWCVQILYLWNDLTTVRIDGHYAHCHRPSMFRALRHGMTYKNHSGKIHSTGVPQEVGYDQRVHEPPIRLFHYGYMEKEMRLKKFEHYMKVDGVQKEFYERECLGPATTAPLASILR